MSVEPERRSVQSCCAATPHKIDLAWLKQNPAQLFNIPVLQQERTDMLAGQAVASCEDTCWRPERQGIASRRTVMKSDVQTHANIEAEPEVLHINLGSDCNLTCVYCSKQYSTAWLRDIVKFGAYSESERFQLNAQDIIVLKLGQKTIHSSNSYQSVLDAAAQYQNCPVTITGGEPFLSNHLVDLIKRFKQKVTVFTGLGVSTSRLQQILDHMPSNVEFVVSAENTKWFYEFARYDNGWSHFLLNMSLLQQQHTVKFSSVISNLTIFDFKRFEEFYLHNDIIPSFCTDPDYLGINVLDNASKDKLQSMNFRTADAEIKRNLAIECTELQRRQACTYIIEYARRRNLSLDIFPKSFTTWLNTPT